MAPHAAQDMPSQTLLPPPHVWGVESVWPAGTSTEQVPPCPPQFLQPGQVLETQQTPSRQKPEAHSPGVVHPLPLGFNDVHCPLRHRRPSTQSPSPEQLPRHCPEGPQRKERSQGSAPCGAHPPAPSQWRAGVWALVPAGHASGAQMLELPCR